MSRPFKTEKILSHTLVLRLLFMRHHCSKSSPSQFSKIRLRTRKFTHAQFVPSTSENALIAIHAEEITSCLSKNIISDLGSLLYTSSWLSAKTASFNEIPTEGNVARVDRSDVLRFTNDYYTYDSGRPQLREEQNRLDDLHGQTVVVHNHLTYWTPAFKETWTFFPPHAPYQKKEQIIFREELWAAAKSGYLCDVLIRGDDFEIPAHCIVLRSVPYYKIMFASMLSEGLESRQRHYQPGNTTNGNMVKRKSNLERTNSPCTTVRYRVCFPRILVLCIHGKIAVGCVCFKCFCVGFDLGRRFL